MDAGILEQVLYHIHNWFERESMPVHTIDDNALPASITDRMLEGQWYRITGSYLNDGLHQHPADDLVDEAFNGTVTLLAIPKALLAVAGEIESWVTLNDVAREKALSSPFQSESFDGYSYSMRGDLSAGSSSGGLAGWQAEFASRLNPWRKMS